MFKICQSSGSNDIHYSSTITEIVASFTKLLAPLLPMALRIWSSMLFYIKSQLETKTREEKVGPETAPLIFPASPHRKTLPPVYLLMTIIVDNGNCPFKIRCRDIKCTSILFSLSFFFFPLMGKNFNYRAPWVCKPIQEQPQITNINPYLCSFWNKAKKTKS